MPSRSCQFVRGDLQLSRYLKHNIAAIAVGAVIGTMARYSLNVALLSSSYPYGTLTENIIGSFLLGWLSGFFVYKWPKEWVKNGLTTGLCGGFTTMSTFAADYIGLIMGNMWFKAVFYMFGSVGGGLLCAWGGYRLGQMFGRRLEGVDK